MTELVMIGFADQHRAAEVLSQLQRLKFDWASDLREGVAVEVESDGRLRMLQSHLLDPAANGDREFEWEALLSAIVPQPHPTPEDRQKKPSTVNAQGRTWLQDMSFDQDFRRNAAALLRPGCSAILAAISDWRTAMELLSGYSSLVLHTTVVRSTKGNEQETVKGRKTGGNSIISDWIYSKETRREQT
jgi:uncharacterized membrane protein